MAVIRTNRTPRPHTVHAPAVRPRVSASPKLAHAKQVAGLLRDFSNVMYSATKWPQATNARITAFKKSQLALEDLKNAFPQTAGNVEVKAVNRELAKGIALKPTDTKAIGRVTQSLEKKTAAAIVSVYDQVMGLKPRGNAEALNGIRAHRIVQFAEGIGSLQKSGRVEGTVDLAVEKDMLWNSKHTKSGSWVGGRGSNAGRSVGGRGSGIGGGVGGRGS